MRERWGLEAARVRWGLEAARVRWGLEAGLAARVRLRGACSRRERGAAGSLLPGRHDAPPRPRALNLRGGGGPHPVPFFRQRGGGRGGVTGDVAGRGGGGGGCGGGRAVVLTLQGDLPEEEDDE